MGKLYTGTNVAFMDPYRTKWPNMDFPAGSTADPDIGAQPDAYWDVIRDAMGATLTYVNQMNLGAMTPQTSLSSSGYCLANPGIEYLVYEPSPTRFTLRLRFGTYQFEWFNPATNLVVAAGQITAPNGEESFSAPIDRDAVLYLRLLAKVFDTR